MKFNKTDKLIDLPIYKVHKNNPIKKTKILSFKVLSISKPTLNCPDCSRPFEMKTCIHTHQRSCIPFFSTVTKQVAIPNKNSTPKIPCEGCGRKCSLGNGYNIHTKRCTKYCNFQVLLLNSRTVNAL